MEINTDLFKPHNSPVNNIINNDMQPCLNPIQNDSSVKLKEETLSKNARRKKHRWNEIKEKNKELRRERKLAKRSRKEHEQKSDVKPCIVKDSSHLSKKERIKKERTRLFDILNESSTNDSPNVRPALKVCIDLQFGDKMSDKELSHLASQLRRAYGANKSSAHPAKLSLVSLDESGRTYKICCEKNDGFQNYILNRTSKSLADEYSSVIEKLVYLTPDSPQTLKELERDKIYVIGGLVDDSVQKDTTYTYAIENNITTAKLPIQEECLKMNNGRYTFKEILTINQVFDILQKLDECKDWGIALSAGLPKRVGYVTKKE